MLWTICVILLILWLLGLVSGYTMGGVIHILKFEVPPNMEVKQIITCFSTVLSY